MTKKRSGIWAICCSMGILFFIIDSKSVIHSAAEGVSLCIHTLVPSMFPLMVLCTQLVGELGRLAKGRLSPADRLWLCGAVGGYPVGGICVNEALLSGAVEHRQAGRLLALCSNAGPAFIFGVCGLMFSSAAAPWLLWLIQLISSYICRQLFAYKGSKICETALAEAKKFSKTVKECAINMALLCAWVILFRVLTDFLLRWLLWLLPAQLQAVVCGLLELSNGCIMLKTLGSEALRLSICAGLLSFGGLCVFLQTKTVAHRVDHRPYLVIKSVQGAVSFGLSYCVCSFRLYGIIFVFITVLLIKFANIAFRARNSPKLAV